MNLFTSLVTLTFLSHSLALADDNSELTAKLLERIEKLEKRVEELEAIAKRVPRDSQPQLPIAPPSIYPQPSIAPNQRYVPPSSSAPSTGVPKSWQPFEFNGQTYYIIPAKEAQPQVGTAATRNPSTNHSDGVQVLKSNRGYSYPMAYDHFR